MTRGCAPVVAPICPLGRNAVKACRTQYNRRMQTAGYPVQFEPVRAEIAWGPLFWTAVGLGAALVIANALDGETQVRRCSICDRLNHDARNCPFDGRRERLYVVKTGRCECCGRRVGMTEGHHYGGRGDGSKGKELCGPCHLHCGHGGNFRNLGINPRYCRLYS